jgi:hypothetical protein
MIAKKDRDIYNFLDMFNSATTSQIYRIFYKGKTLRRCQDRLATLTNAQYINRVKNFLTGEYIYYTKLQKPEQIEHGYYRTELYIKLNERYCVADYDVECKGIPNIRPDMYIDVKLNNMLYMFFVEIHLHNRFNQDKYEQYYKSGLWRDKYKVFPRIIIVAHEPPRLQKTNLNFKIVSTKLNDIEKIFMP